MHENMFQDQKPKMDLISITTSLSTALQVLVKRWMDSEAPNYEVCWLVVQLNYVALLINLATKDLSLLKKVEDSMRDGIHEVSLSIDEKALQAQIRKLLQDDESIFYKPEKVVHKERASKYSQAIKEYSAKAKTFCKNGEIQNAMLVLRIVTEGNLLLKSSKL